MSTRALLAVDRSYVIDMVKDLVSIASPTGQEAAISQY